MTTEIREARVLITEDHLSRMRISECRFIYKSPTLLQKGWKAVGVYRRLPCGSAMTVKREQQSQKMKFYKVRGEARE